MQVTVLHFMKEELHLMTYIALISQRRNILEARCIVLLPEDRILVVEPDSFAIYGIPPLQPMVPSGHAGADGAKPCAIAVGPQWTYTLPKSQSGVSAIHSLVTYEITTGGDRRNVIARCAILTDRFLHVFKICIGPHDCVDVDLVSRRGSQGPPAAAIGVRRAVWFEPAIGMLKTCTFITGQNDDVTRLLGDLDSGSGLDASRTKFGSIQFPKDYTEDVIDMSFDESLGRICVLLCCGEYWFYDLNIDTPRVSLVVMDMV
jgi:hypothetical protein